MNEHVVLCNKKELLANSPTKAISRWARSQSLCVGDTITHKEVDSQSEIKFIIKFVKHDMFQVKQIVA